MRDATKEEINSINEYIASISEDTGANFYDILLHARPCVVRVEVSSSPERGGAFPYINHEIENPCGLFGGFAPYGAKLAEIYINHDLPY